MSFSDTVKRIGQLAWIPIPVFIATIIIFKLTGFETQYSAVKLQLLFNFLFTTLTSVFIIILLGKSFLQRGTPGLLLIGCGALVWGGIGITGLLVKSLDEHVIIIIYNSCICISGLFHLCGGLMTLDKTHLINQTGKWLTILYILSAATVMFIAYLFISGQVPLYYIQGKMGNFVRNIILSSSIAAFVVNALIITVYSDKPLSPFIRWYALSLLLFATGLMGFMAEKVHADPISWTARASQYLSGIYMLIAAIVSTKDLKLWSISMKAALRDSEAAKERAEISDRLKSAFMANLSHELRTPLNSIIGFSGILLQEIPGKLNDEQKKQIGMIQSGGRHLLSLINDILDLSKIEAGQMTVEKEKFDLGELLIQVKNLVEPFALSKELSIIFEGLPNSLEIESDRKKLQQIFLNLLNNAIKFTEKGSVSILCRSDKNDAAIEITDTGIGIEKHNLEKLFQPFVQVENEQNKKYKGSGLGLSICRKMIELLGGTISLESEYGSGSTFRVTLPLVRKF